MKKIVFLLTLFISFCSFCQENKLQVIVGITNVFSREESYNVYLRKGIYTGGRWKLKSGIIGIYGMYQFTNYNSRPSFNFDFQSHLLGGAVEYRILNANKRISPFISISLLSEISTNYKYKYLNIDHWYPMSEPFETTTSNPTKEYYYARFYESIPFYTSFLVGCDVILSKNLGVNLGAGYGLTQMNTKWNYWGGAKELSKEQIEALSINTDWFDMLDIKLGVTYTFSVKK